MAGLTDWHLSRDTPKKSSGVPARPQAAAMGAAIGSAKSEDVNNPHEEEFVHPTKNASDEELKHWADLMRTQKPEHLFHDNVIRRLSKFKATTGDTLKAIKSQSVVGAQSSIHDHGPGGDCGPEAFTTGKKYAHAAPGGSVLEENVKNSQKKEIE